MRREWIHDAGLTALVLAAQTAPFLFAQKDAQASWPAVAYLPVVVSALPVVYRRRQPALCLLVSAMGIAAYGFVEAGPSQPIWYGPLVCMYAVARTAPRTQRIATLIITAIGMVTIVGSLNTAIRELATWSAAYALGALSRTRQEAAIAASAQAAALAAEQERTRIARDLHDILGHSFSLMVVQAEAGASVVRQDPDRAERSFDAISTAGREAMSSLRVAVGALRNASGVAGPRLADVPRLVSEAQYPALTVRLVERGQPRELPAETELAAYRVVQEGLTNVVRHSGATLAEVRLDWSATTLVVTVADDGRGMADSTGHGYGLTGIRERVTALGGAVELGTGLRGRGFKLEAVLT